MKTPVIFRSSLQDLWHYATAIRNGGQCDSEFATASLHARLELLDDASRALSRVGYEKLVNTPWADVWVRLGKEVPQTVEEVEKIGQALLDLVNAECQKQGISGRTGERFSHTDEA